MKKRLWIVLWSLSTRKGIKAFDRRFLTETKARRFYENFVLKRPDLHGCSIQNILENDINHIISTIAMSYMEAFPAFKRLWNSATVEKRTKISLDQAKIVRTIVTHYAEES